VKTTFELLSLFLQGYAISAPKKRITWAQTNLMSHADTILLAELAAKYDDRLLWQIPGGAALSGSQMWGLFNPLIKLKAATEWFDSIERAFSTIKSNKKIIVLPPDPYNPYFMIYENGLSIYESAAHDTFIVRLWPSPTNIEKLNYYFESGAKPKYNSIDIWNNQSWTNQTLGYTSFDEIPVNIFGDQGTMANFKSLVS